MAASESLARNELRPSGMGAIVARSFRLLLRHFLSSFLLGVLCWSVVVVLLAYALVGASGWIVVPAALALYIAAFYWYAAIILRVSYALIGMRVAWRQILRRLRGLLAVRLLIVSLAILALWSLSLVPFSLLIDRVIAASAGAHPAVRALGVLIVLLTVMPFLYVWTSSLFAPTVVVLESVGPRRAILRSWQLIRGRRWEIAATYTIGLAFYVIGAVLVERFRHTMGDEGGAVILIGALAYLAFFPWFIILSVLLYYDLRVRKEFLNVRALQHQIT